MADKVLRWTVNGVLSETGVVDTNVHGESYRADKDYVVVATHVRVKTAPQGDDGIVIDINDDGVSIFGDGQEPTLPDNTTETEWDNFFSQALVIFEGSIITLDIDQVGNEYAGKDLVVELELNSMR